MRSGLAMTAICAALATASAASAQYHKGGYYVDGHGARWYHEENRHGAVLRNGRARIYLGRDCEALSPQFGRGRWDWANGGVLVAFRRHRIAFARQDPPLDRDGRGPFRCSPPNEER